MLDGPCVRVERIPHSRFDLGIFSYEERRTNWKWAQFDRGKGVHSRPPLQTCETIATSLSDDRALDRFTASTSDSVGSTGGGINVRGKVGESELVQITVRSSFISFIPRRRGTSSRPRKANSLLGRGKSYFQPTFHFGSGTYEQAVF